jgi:hypothetical protein
LWRQRIKQQTPLAVPELNNQIRPNLWDVNETFEKTGAGAVFADFSLASRAGCGIIAGRLECSFTDHLLSFDMKASAKLQVRPILLKKISFMIFFNNYLSDYETIRCH